MPLSKQQAADRLGCKIRSVELYAQQGRLSVHYTKGKRGRVAQFDEAEIDRLKAELEQQTIYPQRPALALRANESESLAKPIAGLEVLASILAQVNNGHTPDLAQLAQKLVLTIPEAVMLSGVSEQAIKRAIHAGELAARRDLGRGWRVRRTALEAWVDSL
jgi:excisionase family DNA binding protein